jgi:hypothetical protein
MLGSWASLRYRTDLGGMLLRGRSLAAREAWGGGAWGFTRNRRQVLVLPAGDADEALASPLALVPDDHPLVELIRPCHDQLDRELARRFLAEHVRPEVPTSALGQVREDVAGFITAGLPSPGEVVDLAHPVMAAALAVQIGRVIDKKKTDRADVLSLFDAAAEFLSAASSEATWLPMLRVVSPSWARLASGRAKVLDSFSMSVPMDMWKAGHAELATLLEAHVLAAGALRRVAQAALAREPAGRGDPRDLAASLIFPPLPLIERQVAPGTERLALPSGLLLHPGDLFAVDTGLYPLGAPDDVVERAFTRAVIDAVGAAGLEVDPWTARPRRIGLAWGPRSLLARRVRS